MHRLTLLDKDDRILFTQKSDSPLCVTLRHTYAPGDHLQIETDRPYIYLSVDEHVPAGRVWIPGGTLIYRFPTDSAALEPYPPEAFRGDLHTYTLAEATGIRPLYRNLALNPVAQRAFEGGYPYIHANVETRDESVFFARNVIDGVTTNSSHGVWPYQSWGIGLSETAEIQIDFGREVEIDAMDLVLRADFPHDAYWTQATVTLSNGHEQTFPLIQTAAKQHIAFDRPHRVTSARLHHLVKQIMDSPFPALSQWEVWGRG